MSINTNKHWLVFFFSTCHLPLWIRCVWCLCVYLHQFSLFFFQCFIVAEYIKEPIMYIACERRWRVKRSKGYLFAHNLLDCISLLSSYYTHCVLCVCWVCDGTSGDMWMNSNGIFCCINDNITHILSAYGMISCTFVVDFHRKLPCHASTLVSNQNIWRSVVTKCNSSHYGSMTN